MDVGNINSLSLHLNEPGDALDNLSASVGEITLYRRVVEKIPQKNFNTEVRALKDIKNFLKHPVLLLDLEETSLEEIATAVIVKVLGKELSTVILEKVMDSLFTEDSVLADIIQGGVVTDEFGLDYDQSWVCALCSLPVLNRSYVAVSRFRDPVDFGPMLHSVRLFILVLAPTNEKNTKNAIETGRTFATLFKDFRFRRKIMELEEEDDVKKMIISEAESVAMIAGMAPKVNLAFIDDTEDTSCRFARGLRSDFKRRLAFYVSDYIDGFVGPKTLHKTLSTIFFLYFGCILPTIAFGKLHDTNTSGAIDVKKCIIAQTIGGLLFAMFGGQPLVIIMTTAPLSIYIKVIYNISKAFQLDFISMYACVGLWNSFFLFVYALFDASRLMKWCTRSTEEIFSLFIAITFTIDSAKSAYRDFEENYLIPQCYHDAENETSNFTANLVVPVSSTDCRRDSSLLFLLLMFGTVWLGVTLYNFKKTPYLEASKREILSDYALPLAVLVFSFIGSFLFQGVPTKHFEYNTNQAIVLSPFYRLPWTAVLASMGLGFALSLLFFMDQNISAAMVNNPLNRLHKGPAYHFDLLVVGAINAFLSLFGLPWMHGVLPHSPLHARRLADVEDRLDQGHVYEVVVKSRETRVTGMFAHFFIGLSILMLPYPLAYIPTAVLNGLFLFMAVSSLGGNHMFERFLLIFTEQTAYPPNHYIRRCPQREIHKFTFCQVIQLIVICIFGFYPIPYVMMIFPVIIFLLVPLRYKILPYVIDSKYLDVLDGSNKLSL